MHARCPTCTNRHPCHFPPLFFQSRAPQCSHPPFLPPQKRKELSAVTEGPVLLLEYLEELPLLLPQMGMGARLTTIYRKTSSNDSAHHQLRNESKPWQVGAVHALAPEDESPLLGNIKRGRHLFF